MFDTVAQDDAIDLLNQLVTKCLARAENKGEQVRLHTIQDLDAAAIRLNVVCKIVLDPMCEDGKLRSIIVNSEIKCEYSLVDGNLMRTVERYLRKPESVMIFEWLKPFTQSTIFQPTIFFGESNGSVGWATTRNVPSDPLIDVCLAQLPGGETNPLSARSRSSQTKKTVRIGIGLLPYISIASVWRRHRPVPTNLAASRHRLRIDTSS
jgi:hypothetical protein